MRTNGPSIIVSGASCQIGHFLLPRLAKAGFQVHALSRHAKADDGGPVTWHQADLAGSQALELQADGLIHLAPLTLLPGLLPRLDTTRLSRIIAFGSTSRYTKAGSADPAERAFAEDLEKAENTLAEFCKARHIHWTIFRPTLIYGCGRDKNVTVIARFLRRFRIFPLLGGDGGLRQPVHADDLALACLQAWEKPAAFDRGYNLSGGEVMTYRAMVERIFRAEALAPRFLPVPLPLLRLAIRSLRLIPRYRYLSMEMVDRMAADLSFDHADAQRDFGFAPRGFEPPTTGA
jgi:nucleoside-diphosphate-sugar epimerase